ncbi:extracellular solute-binding protein [Subtercola sp. YIM 133946]|uniref:extracellular solute-binding protein n=1 Tax=Subtercola sp. YIM 133946 TaxID=3118909 RepID=UPI002F91DBCE
MTRYVGLTWDHPRGVNALRAAERARGTDSFGIDWNVHPLEGFESHPIAELAARYDLIVLDHPHLGEACADGVLRPLDDYFSPEQLAAWARDAVGPSFSSYSLEGRQWAVPLDAATQVAAVRLDLVAEVPQTWHDVIDACHDGRVALSLSGPHAFLSFSSLCVAFGEAPQRNGDTFVSHDTGARALATLRSIAARAVVGTESQSPIELLQRMSSTDDIAYIPLVYGYVNYSSPTLRFTDAPLELRRGSTIGGTGLALTQRCVVTPDVLAHIEWLMSAGTQTTFIPGHQGQPSHRGAWGDDVVGRQSHGFYSSTLATIEGSWVRPRYTGFIGFQSEGSAIIRRVLSGDESIRAGLEQLDHSFRASQQALARTQGAGA